MRVAIMQPYFFPYIGYFQLIKAADRFILFDEVQYIRHGWINRNRILKPVTGWQYITMPLVTHSRDTLIKDIQVADVAVNKGKILRQLQHYKKTAPHYKAVMELLGDCLIKPGDNIVTMNARCLKAVCDYIGIPFTIEIASQLYFDYSGVQHAGEWALRMSEQLKATAYINPVGGRALFNPVQFEQSNIRLQFLQTGITTYSQRRNDFEPGLSIIDVMLFNEPAQINNFLNEYELV